MLPSDEFVFYFGAIWKPSRYNKTSCPRWGSDDWWKGGSGLEGLGSAMNNHKQNTSCMEIAHLFFSSQQLLASFHRWIGWKLWELDNFLSVLASGVAWCRNDLPGFHRSCLVRGLVWNITFWFPFQGAGVWEHGLGTSVHPWWSGRGVSTWAIIRHSVFWGFLSDYIYSIQGWIITFKWGQRNGTPTRMYKWVNG